MRYIGVVPRLFQVAVLSAAFVLPGWQAEAADKDGNFVRIGQGAQSCGLWTSTKTNDLAGAFMEHAWVLGYVTAFNEYAWKGNNVASETDTPGLLAWIDNYCAANPTQKIGTAAAGLIKFLSAGPHPNDK